MRIKESFGRGLVSALRSQFSSPAQALREIVDNAIDQSQGQRVHIELVITSEKIVVENRGGRGMGLCDLAEFVSWGLPKPRAEDDFGKYSQGGKAAMSYLGDSYKLWCRRSETSETYCLEDHRMLASSEPRDYGDVHPLAVDLVPEHLRTLERKAGFVRIEIGDLDSALAIDEEKIRKDLAAVYGRLLRRGRITLTLNGAAVDPREIVLDHAVEPVSIAIHREGLHIEGFAGKLARDSNRANMPKPGFSLYWRGRRLEEGQWFSGSGYGKGSLAAFYGEIEVRGWTPNLNKSGFIDAGSAQWIEIGEELLRQAKPVLDVLRTGSDTTHVTSRDRRLAKQVQRDLATVMSLLFGERVIEVEEHKLKKIRLVKDGPSEERVKNREGKGPTSPKKTEEGDEDRTVKTERIIPDIPEIVIETWEGSSRAETREDKGRLKIYINKAHPAFAASSARYAIAQAAICEMLRVGGGIESIDDYSLHVDEALASWASQVSTEDDD